MDRLTIDSINAWIGHFVFTLFTFFAIWTFGCNLFVFLKNSYASLSILFWISIPLAAITIRGMGIFQLITTPSKPEGIEQKTRSSIRPL